jgi:uncharacterized protein
MIPFLDTLQNFLSGMLMARRDKAVSSTYTCEELTPEQLECAYRGDWLARKIITIPAWDATREWREWQAEQDQIEKLEDVEDSFNLKGRVREALIKARLYGGAGIVIGVPDEDQTKPLDPARLGKDCIKFLHVVTRHELSALQGFEDDITSPWYGLPKTYSVRTTTVNRTSPLEMLHPSRLVRFIGNDPPNINYSMEGWGDSVLIAVNEAVRAAGMTTLNLAQLINEAKVDFIKVPNLTNIFTTKEASAKYVERMTYINACKSSTNAVLMDKEEDWDRTQLSFTGMPEVLDAFLIVASGAADIPATRLLGRSPAGMNATGDSDTRNYYDRIRSDQSLRMSPAMRMLDDVIQVHALGAVDPDIHYEWVPLWQMSEDEKAKIGKLRADAVKVIVDSGLVPLEALAKGFQNQLIESGDYPGLEAAIADANAADDFVPEPLQLTLLKEKPVPPPPQLPKPNGGGPPAAGGPPPKGPREAGDADALVKRFKQWLDEQNENGETVP